MKSVLIVILLSVAAVQAQSPAPYVIIPSVPAPRDPLPRFTIPPRGGVLGHVGLPLPHIGLQPPPSARHRSRRSREGVFVPSPEGVFFPWPMMVFYVPQPIAAPAPAPNPPPVEKPPAAGRLIIDVEPATAQVFADGYYIGVPGDFSAGRGGGLLEAGAHRIDVSATGYEPFTATVRVTADQPVTIQATLKPLPPPVAVPPTTFYLIPGCYMGNIPPKEARLPATCDQSRVISWLP